jgi:predicted nucleotidyltransferase
MPKTQLATFKPPSAGDPVLSEVVRRLSEVYRPVRIYLFGSAARGDAGPDSDYDIMVVAPDDTPADLRRSRRGYRAIRDLGVPRDIFVSTTRDFQTQLHLKASFPSTVVREGILLYAP